MSKSKPKEKQDTTDTEMETELGTSTEPTILKRNKCVFCPKCERLMHHDVNERKELVYACRKCNCTRPIQDASTHCLL